MAEFDARRAFDALSDAALAADDQQRIWHANPAAGRLLGWPPEDLVGRLLAELIPPPHEPMDLDKPVQVRVLKRDGSLREVELVLSSSVDGGPEILVATLREPPCRDAEDATHRLRAILETISIGVILIEGPERSLTVINPMAHQLAGEPIAAKTYDEFVARYPLQKTDGLAMEPGERPLSRTIREGESVRETLKYRRPDGRELILAVTTAPLGDPPGGAITTFADVTERSRLEQDLTERAAQFRTLLDHLPVGVAYFDKMAVCRAGNGPARRFFGRSRGAIDGATADELLAHSAELRDALHRCVDNHRPYARQRVSWPDGSRPGGVRYLDWQFEPLSPDPSRSRGAIALMMDVTERARAEEERQRALEAAEEASRRKTQFLSAVSHDLRTPINALSLQAELLARIVDLRDDPGGELQLLAGDIRAVSANLIELINDLLDLTKFDSGAVDFRPSEFALDRWLATTVAPLELSARTKGLEFRWATDRPGRVLRTDRVKLGRVLVNLVGNAVKFTDEGEVAIRAGVDDQGWFRLEVRDTGSGIPSDQIGRIFDEFAQLRNPERDRTKGTGLGLAICRRLVEGVGGRLTVTSEPGRGSVFAASYPPEHLVEAPDATTETAETATLGSGPPTGETLLIVDDDPSSRQVLGRLLEQAGYLVETAASGPEALEVAARARPALVLLDLILPGIDGAEVLKRLRAEDRASKMKVVILTGDLLPDRDRAVRDLGADDLLAKPVDLPALLALVHRLVAEGEP